MLYSYYTQLYIPPKNLIFKKSINQQSRQIGKNDTRHIKTISYSSLDTKYVRIMSYT